MNVSLLSVNTLTWVFLLAFFALPFHAQAAVANVALLQGSQLADDSVNLNSTTAKSIKWTQRSSIDPRKYKHSFNDASKLVVNQDGDYLVAATVPYVSIDDNDNRPSHSIEIYVNGQAAPGALGQTSYIRNQPRNANMQRESSDHVHALLRGLKANDTIELRVAKNSQAGILTAIQRASLYVEQVDASRTVFAGLSSGPAQGSNLNADTLAAELPVKLAWNSARKDAGFTHTDGSANINLTAGTYLVFANIPMASSVARASVGLEVTLDGFIVPGGTARQGYIRNAGGHNRASVHWAGLVRATGNQVLGFQTVRYGQSGNVTVQSGKQASVFVEKLSNNNGVFFSRALQVDNVNNPDDWNPANKTAILWESPDTLNDNAVYNRGGARSQIQVRQAGSYLLLYQDTLQSTGARVNPRISVDVNGVFVRGAETKTHYIRNTDGHNHASATLVFLLENLAANDTITVNTEREGNTQGTFIDEFANEAAILALVKKDTLTLAANDATPPRLSFFSGNVLGFEAQIQDFGRTVNLASVQAFQNGNKVAIETSQAGGVTTLSHTFNEFPAVGSKQTIKISFNDNATPPGAHEAEVSYVIVTPFTRVSPGFVAANVDKTKSGFVARVTQISTLQSGSGSLHNNNIEAAEQQLRGEYKEPSGQPFYNEADPAGKFGSPWTVVNRDVETVINWEQEALNAGNFNADNGFPDGVIPGIPGSTGLTDGIVAEIFTYLEMKKGFHTLGVNSDDGFKLTSGPNVRDVEAVTLGFFDGGRGAADSLFNVVVSEDGIYPMRLLWFEGTGGANVEFFSVHENQKILINDRSNPNAIKAYRSAQTRPFVSKVEPPSQELSSKVEFVINDDALAVVNGTIKLSIDGQDKTSAASISKSGKVTTVVFDNKEFFAGGNHTATLSYDENSTPPMKRTVAHHFRVPQGLSAVLLDKPFAYWRFGESSGTQFLSELGSGLTGTYLNDPTLGVDRLIVGDTATAVAFDKSKGQWVDIPDHPEINDSPNNPGWKEKTVEVWFRARNLPTSAPLGAGAPQEVKQSQVIYEQGGATRGITVYLRGTQPGPNPTEAQLWFNVLNRAEQAWGGILPFEQMNSSGGVMSPNGAPVAVSTTIKANEIYHAVMVMKGDDAPDSFEGTLTGYLNGQKFGEVKGVHLLYDHTDDVSVAARNEEAAFHDFIASGTWSSDWWALGDLLHFDGTIGSLALYNTALTEAQVKAHFEAGRKEVPLPTGGKATIAIARGAGATLTLTFEGTLQSADNVAGPWTDVAGGSPQTINVGQQGAAKFYRTRR